MICVKEYLEDKRITFFLAGWGHQIYWRDRSSASASFGVRSGAYLNKGRACWCHGGICYQSGDATIDAAAVQLHNMLWKWTHHTAAYVSLIF